MSFKTTVNLLDDWEFCGINCRISRGQLLPVPAPVKITGSVPSGVKAVFHSEGEGKFFACTQDRVYTSGDGTGFNSYQPIDGTSPFLIEDIEEGNVRAVLVNGSNAVVYKNGADMGFSYGANLSCGVMHCGRLFGADGGDGLIIRWSGEGGLSDWECKIDGSGSVKLDPEAGAVIDILEYGEKLVALRKFGLTVLSMYGSPENFSVGFDGSCAEIYRNTAKAVGGKLLFFTSAGLRSFDGSVISEVEHGHSRDISKPVCAAAFDGKYYLSCFSKRLNSDVVFCYSPEDGASWLIGVKADALCAADGLYAFNALGAYKLEEGGEYSFTKKLDFGSDARKTLNKIFIGGTAVLEISNGIYSRKFAGAHGTVRPRMRGRSFTVTVKGSQPVYKLTATAEECNAV